MIFRIFLLVTFLFSSGAFAKGLPASAVKLTTKELKTIYSGKSSNWTGLKGYFAPNGTHYVISTDNKYVEKALGM